jgi:hypothetical protein
MSEEDKAAGTVASWFAREMIVATLVAPSLQAIGGSVHLTLQEKNDKALSEIRAAVRWSDAIIAICKQTPATQ